MDTKDLNNLFFYIIWTTIFIYLNIFILLYSLSYLSKWADQSIERWVKGTSCIWSCWNNSSWETRCFFWFINGMHHMTFCLLLQPLFREVEFSAKKKQKYEIVISSMKKKKFLWIKLCMKKFKFKVKKIVFATC